MTDASTQGTVCIANIGPRQRRVRLASGVVMALVAAGWLTVTLGLDLPRLWRLGVLLPAWLSALGFLQHREKT